MRGRRRRRGRGRRRMRWGEEEEGGGRRRRKSEPRKMRGDKRDDMRGNGKVGREGLNIHVVHSMTIEQVYAKLA